MKSSLGHSADVGPHLGELSLVQTPVSVLVEHENVEPA